ncbi:MAG: DUF899 family protein [Verrucomicrobiota bacterium]
MSAELSNNQQDAEKRYIEHEALTQNLAKVSRASKPVPVDDFVLQQSEGTIKLSECFEGKRDLIVIYNMGIGCPYCTVWADGINGVQAHMRDRAGLVLISADDMETLAKTCREREWKFPVAANADSGFFAAMGMDPNGTGEPWPGMSTFHLNESGGIEHISTESFGPFDLFSPLWHFIGRLKDGVDGWKPRVEY